MIAFTLSVPQDPFLRMLRGMRHTRSVVDGNIKRCVSRQKTLTELPHVKCSDFVLGKLYTELSASRSKAKKKKNTQRFCYYSIHISFLLYYCPDFLALSFMRTSSCSSTSLASAGF